MTQKGFENYLYTVFSNKSGTAGSYAIAIRIIDQMFAFRDVFELDGKSITCIDDADKLKRIAEFIRAQQTLFKEGKDSLFSNVSPKQLSYPLKGFCSAAMTQLLDYNQYCIKEKQAELIIQNGTVGTKVAKQLDIIFDLEKVGKDIESTTKGRLGQSYFRKMVLSNYDNKCCVTGLNVSQTLRASHIVAWAEDKKHRMDPENGLCLSATYDAAFDKHLISFDEDYRMIVSKRIKEYYTNKVTQEYFGDFEGKQMMLPLRFFPNQKLLEKHRELLVV